MRGWVTRWWWGLGAASPPYLGCIEDLLDLQDVGDVPCVLGEGAQGKGVLADKGCRERAGREGVREGSLWAFLPHFLLLFSLWLRPEALSLLLDFVIQSW